MKINKSLNIDLNIISSQKHIRIHEGDVDSVDILIGVTVDDESVDLNGVSIKYDATINNYLAEQDADGSVVDDKISIPVTQNMTAMSGLLLIDVRMIQNDQILFTQTICATVEKAVVNGSTYIDFDKITIVQRMNALEEKMDYIEELVENFDTSKLIVSADRPPMGAPVEVDVDLLRVGDTWILSGYNIVYKLVKAQYNYQPTPDAEPYHRFIWQPLNERFGVDNTEPPTTKTYQQIVYTINEVQWSWLPVPEYFQGDHYQMLVDGESTYYICVSGNMADTGVCTYTWRKEGGGASSGITIINTETVPESAEWGDSIPASYAGNTGKVSEIAYWEESGYFWGLCSLATDPITGNINYNWVRQADEIDIFDLKASIATKMNLAPLNPTAEQIAALPSGQLYSDVNAGTVNIKNGVQLLGVLSNGRNPEYGSAKGELGQISYYAGKMYQCFGRNAQDTAYVWKLISYAGSDVISARATTTGASGDYIISSSTTLQEVWELFTKYRCVKVEITDQRGIPTGYVCWITNVTGNNHENLSAFMLPSISATPTSPVYERIHFLVQNGEGSSDTLRLETKYVYPPYEKYYTREETDDLLNDKMDLAPLNPTAEEIEDMPDGQLYGDTVNHKGIIKGRQEFYDKDYIDSTINHAYKSALMPPYQSIAAYGGSGILKVGDLWECTRNPRTQTFVLSDISTDDNWTYILNWEKLCPGVNRGMEQPITQETISRADYRNANIGIEYAFPRPTYLEGQIYLVDYNGGIDTIFVCAQASTSVSGNNTMTAYYRWGSCYSRYLVYTKDEVDSMIGDIETALSEV